MAKRCKNCGRYKRKNHKCQNKQCISNFDLEKIKELYVNEKKSTREIGKVFRVGKNLIIDRLKAMNIKIRKNGEGKKIDSDLKKIRKLYVNQKKTIKEIAKILNVSISYIHKRLKKAKINRSNKIKLNFKKIKELYINEKKTTFEIGKILGVSDVTILNRLKEMNIQLRDINKFYKGQHRSPKTEFKKGEKHRYFNNWSSFEPYGKEFNEELKEQIRIRDNHTCQECGKHQKELKRKLDVHHIDYNKKNNNPLNLISLCKKCHVKINGNREHWINYFKMKMFIRELFDPRNILIFNENKQLIGINKI